MAGMGRINRTLTYVGLFISLVIVGVFAQFIGSISRTFYDYYDHQLKNYSSILRKTISLSGEYNKLYEQAMADDMYHRLSALNQNLRNIPLQKVTGVLLRDWCDEFDFFAMAVIAKDEDGLYVYASTFPEEVGDRTKGWGYWDSALNSLYEGRTPAEEGYSRKNYWIGPRSKSYYAEGYFRYAYYFIEDQGYIINGIVRDDRVQSLDMRNTLDVFFEHLKNDVAFIDRIALIDLQAYEKAYNNNFKNPEAPVYLYGSFSLKLLEEAGLAPEDLYSVGSDRSFDILYEGQKRVIFVSPVEERGKNYLLGILLDEGDREYFVKRISAAFVFFLVFTLGVLYFGIFVIVKKYGSLLTFEKERNSEIETFSRNIALLPENIYKCRRRDGELMLTYNYGRAIDKEEEITLESAYRPLRDFYPADYIEEFRRLTEDAFNGHPGRFQISSDGNHFEHFVSPILDEDGNVLEIIGIATNINDRRLEEEQARYLATHDYLTGLANRREFEDRVKKKIYENPGGNFALMILDLDDFKTLNDSYGHLAGDAVLMQFADRLKGISEDAPEKIFASRMGGDEFALFCTPENREDAGRIAEKIISSSMKSYEIREGKINLNLGMSMGVALNKGPGINYRKMFYSADVAMYQAKKSAGSTCVFYEEEMGL